MTPKPTFGFWLDKRRAKKDGRFPVKIWIRIEEKQIFFPAKIDLTTKEWKAANKPFPKNQALKHKKHLDSLHEKIDTTLEEMHSWDAKEFRNRLYKGKTGKFPINLQKAFEHIATRLEEEERIGTASSYRTAAKSFLQAWGPSKQINKITPTTLRKYEKHMLNAEKSATTIGIYLRSLRVVINEARNSGIELDYPFGKHKYQIQQSRNPKKALSTEELKQLLNPENADELEKFEHALWRFVFYANGINTADLIQLKYKNIVGDEILFVREKTKRYMNDTKIIHIPLLDPIRQIIEEHGNPPAPDSYIFPILTGKEPPEEQRRKKKLLTRRIHHRMTRLANRLGINKKISVLTARHSFGTMLKRSGVPLSHIQDAYGHKTESTTQKYLSGHEEEKRRKYNSRLLDDLEE